MAGPAELVRVARERGPAPVLVVGPGPGRGAWLCRGSPACLERALRHGALARALRATVAPEAVDGLRMLLGRDAPSGERAAAVCEDGGSGRHGDPRPREEEGP